MTNATALSALARVTWKRTLRRKTLWVGAVIALLPTLFANFARGHSVISDVDDTFNVAMILLAIVPPLFVASAIAEEIDERTATYLWSRPVGRWTIVIGKLLALAPLTIVILVVSWALPSLLYFHGEFLVEPALALATGALAVSLVSAGIAAILPKHGMALTIVYMLVDLMIGALPTSLGKLSLTFHVMHVANRHLDANDHLLSAVALAAISLVWLVAGLRRIRRVEV
jgi:hypothetical protein